MRARALEPELMDDPGIAPEVHERALAGLRRINALSRSGAGVWRAMRPLLEGGTRGHVLDVATGSGDVIAGVVRRAGREGITLEPTLCDVSGRALEGARARAARAGVERARTAQADVVREGLPFEDRAFDVAMCTLFLHHLTREDAVRVLREMARVAGRGIVVGDLRRSRAGLGAAWIAGRTLTRSEVVRVDAVRSVRAAFSEDELREMAAEAGLGGACVERCPPWRMMLTWRRS